MVALTEKLVASMAARPSDREKAKYWDSYVAALTSAAGAKILAEYQIDQNPQRLVMILANMMQETGGFTLVWESMKYSAERLLKIFGRAAGISPEEAGGLAYKEQEIAERVYGLGNPRKARELGNTEPGDGWRYRGGGFLQTTGRDNYRTLGERIGVDLEGHPELIEDPLVSLKAACAEWHRTGLNAYADKGDFRACCMGINYGDPKRPGDPIGFDERLRRYRQCCVALNLPRPRSILEGAGDLAAGDLGPEVEALQSRLGELGYWHGEADGLFTTSLRVGVLALQADNALPTTGKLDQATKDLLAGHEVRPRRGEARELEVITAPQAATQAPASGARRSLAPAPEATVTAAAVPEPTVNAADDIIEDEWWHEPDQSLAPQRELQRRLRPALTADQVSWADLASHPDYRHLDTSFAEEAFDFVAADLDLIIRANRFEPTREQQRILFGLRGAVLAKGSKGGGATLQLRLARPNHRDFLCVIGVYDTSTGHLSAFMGSTVPWFAYVYDYYARGGGDPKTNMLPTGCYPYFVGAHGKHQIPGCLRLGTGLGDNQQEQVAVLRTLNDLTYDSGDAFDPSVPHDNLHPSFGTRTFQSRGCQTVRGSYGNGHTGEWAEFRQAVGLGDRGDNGRRFDYVLITGMEAAIASKLRRSETIPSPTSVLQRLTRLRHGSRGELVKSLQQKLRLPATGLLGAQETAALAALQKQKFGSADGAYSPDLDARLGFNIFSNVPLETASRERQITPGASRIALVVGVSAYKKAPPLGNPGNDATAIADRLGKLGFDVTLLCNETGHTILQAIDQFSDALRNKAEVGFIFFAGHGAQIDGENYLLPVDCEVSGEANFRGSAIPLSLLLDPIQKSQKAGIVFLDCCRDNPFGGQAGFRSLSYRGFAKIDAPIGTFIAFSTAPGTTASDGLPGAANSPFVVALLERIDRQDLRISDLMMEVRQEVFKTTAGQQLPWESTSLLTPFAFKQTKGDLGGPENLAQTAKEREEQYWDLSNKSGNEQLIESFIAQFPYSRHRSLADDKLNALKRQRARKKLMIWGGSAAASVALLFGIVQGINYNKIKSVNGELKKTSAALEAVNSTLYRWQARTRNGQFTYMLGKIDLLKGDNPEAARALALAVRRKITADGKDVDLGDFTNRMTEWMAPRPDVEVKHSTTTQPVKAAFTPDGKYIVWAEDDQSDGRRASSEAAAEARRLLLISDMATGERKEQAREATKVKTLITSPDGSHAAILSQDGDAELFFLLGSTPRDYKKVFNENDIQAIAFGKSGERLFLAAVDKNGDVHAWRFSSQGGPLEAVAVLERKPRLARDQSKRTGRFAIGCHDATCLWVEPDGSTFAAELGPATGSVWRPRGGTSKLEGWSLTDSSLISLAKGQLYAYTDRRLSLYRFDADRDPVITKLGEDEIPELSAMSLDEEQDLAVVTDKSSKVFVLQPMTVESGRLVINTKYQAELENNALLDFNNATKSLVFSSRREQGRSVLELRRDVVWRHTCASDCDNFRWLGSHDSKLFGVEGNKLHIMEFNESLAHAPFVTDVTQVIAERLRKERLGDNPQRPELASAIPPSGAETEPLRVLDYALDRSGSVLVLVAGPRTGNRADTASPPESRSTDAVSPPAESLADRLRSTLRVAMFRDGKLVEIAPVRERSDATAARPVDLVLAGTYRTSRPLRESAKFQVESARFQVLVALREGVPTIYAMHDKDPLTKIRAGGQGRILRLEPARKRIALELPTDEHPGDGKAQATRVRQTIPVAGGVVDFGFLDDGSKAYVADTEGSVEIWDLKNKTAPQKTIATRMKMRGLVWSKDDAVLYVNDGYRIKSFNREGRLLNAHLPGRAVDSLVPLSNGQLFAVIGSVYDALPAVDPSADTRPWSTLADAMTPNWVSTADRAIADNWILPEPKEEENKNAEACATTERWVNQNYHQECSRLFNDSPLPSGAKKLAIATHATAAVEQEFPGLSVAFAMARVATDDPDPVAIALIAREEMTGRHRKRTAPDALVDLTNIDCQENRLHALRELFAYSVRKGGFVSPFQFALELHCAGGGGTNIANLAKELEAAASDGDVFALALLGYKLEQEGDQDKALEHYGVAGRLLLAHRDQKLTLPDQQWIELLETLIGQRRENIANRLSKKSVIDVWTRVDRRYRAIIERLRAQTSSVASGETHTLAPMLQILSQPDLSAAIAEGKQRLAELTGKDINRLSDFALRARQGLLLQKISRAQGTREKTLAYVDFLKEVDIPHESLFLGAARDLALLAQGKGRGAEVPVPALEKLVKLIVETEDLENAPLTAMDYNELSQVAKTIGEPEFAARLAIGALNIVEGYEIAPEHIAEVADAQARVLNLVAGAEDARRYSQEFGQLGWKYRDWINNYRSARLDVDDDKILGLIRDGLRLHEYYITSLSDGAQPRQLERLASAYNAAASLDAKRPDLTERMKSALEHYSHDAALRRAVIHKLEDTKDPTQLAQAWRNLAIAQGNQADVSYRLEQPQDALRFSEEGVNSWRSAVALRHTGENVRSLFHAQREHFGLYVSLVNDNLVDATVGLLSVYRSLKETDAQELGVVTLEDSVRPGVLIGRLVRAANASMPSQPDLCDLLAAHGSDPLSTGPGVVFEKIKTEEAVQACTQASARSGSPRRFAYQLARAYSPRGSDRLLPDDVVARFRALMDAGYPIAFNNFASNLGELGDYSARAANYLEFFNRTVHCCAKSAAGYLLARGRGREPIKDAALILLAWGARLGSPSALEELARLVLDGVFLPDAAASADPRPNLPATVSREAFAYYHLQLAVRMYQTGRSDELYERHEDQAGAARATLAANRLRLGLDPVLAASLDQLAGNWKFQRLDAAPGWMVPPSVAAANPGGLLPSSFSVSAAEKLLAQNSRDISGVMIWSETPQGHNYWSKASRELTEGRPLSPEAENIVRAWLSIAKEQEKN